MEYPYLSIDKDGTAYECKTPPFNNGLGKWFTLAFFGEDSSMRKVEKYNKNDYLKVFSA